MYGCYQSLDLCAVRASVLNADGTRIGSNPNGSAYNLRPISLGRSPIVATGDTFEQRDGCGNICVSITDPDVTTGETLTLTLCQLDLELISLLTGGSVLLDGTGEVYGIEAPDPGNTVDPVEFHVWTKAYSGSSQVASPRNYWHWVFPYTQWNIGDWTIERGILSVSLTGKAAANANLGSGSFGDLPPAGVQQFFGVWLDNDIPDSAVSPYNANGLSCGFVDTPALAS
jgi:hypothetical protein